MDALRWLQKQQQETGCFRSVEKLFNNILQVGRWGGVGHGNMWPEPGWPQHVPGVWSRWWGSPCAGGTAWPDPFPLSPLQGGVSDELSLSGYRSRLISLSTVLLELGLSQQ